MVARTVGGGISGRGSPAAGDAAARAGAQFAVLDGLGHWWMVQDPGRGAAALTEFWASVNWA